MAAKKPQSKNKSLFKKSIDLNSPKGRLIVILLSFAVIGGGIYVYRSFASTPSWAYNIANQGLVAVHDPAGTCRATVANDVGKNPIQLVNLACTPTPSGFATAKITGLNYTIIPNNSPAYRLCANIKGNGSGVLSMNVPFQSGPYKTSINATAEPNNYKYVCTQYVYPPITGKITGDFTVKGASTFLNVSGITIEQLSSDYGSTASTASTTTAPVTDSKNPL